MALKPLGSLVSLSPWEFQIWRVSGSLEKRAADAIVDGEGAFAVFAFLAGFDFAAEELGESWMP